MFLKVGVKDGAKDATMGADFGGRDFLGINEGYEVRARDSKDVGCFLGGERRCKRCDGNICATGGDRENVENLLLEARWDAQGFGFADLNVHGAFRTLGVIQVIEKLGLLFDGEVGGFRLAITVS